MRRAGGIVVLFALPWLGCTSAHDIDRNTKSEMTAAQPVDLACVKEGVDPLDGLHQRLECAGLYADIVTKKLAEGVELYKPAVELWSDGAEKSRWIWLPKGTKIDASTPGEWSFPVGTKFFKEFAVGGHRIETRLFEKASDHWVRTTYQWNSDETSATRSLGGDIPLQGGASYHLPAAKECDQCHQGRIDRALGFEQIALGLSGAKGLTLPMLVQKGLISPAPQQTSIQIADDGTGMAGGTDGTLGWMHINCGVSCHNDNPSANGHSTRLRMRLDPTQLDGRPASQYPPLQTTLGVAALTVRWGGKTRIVPGAPDQSLLYQLVSVRGGAANDQMPPIASRVVDQPYADKIAAWIRSMPPLPVSNDAGAATPSPIDAGSARIDAGTVRADAGMDASTDAGTVHDDAGSDAGHDAGKDAGTDAAAAQQDAGR